MLSEAEIRHYHDHGYVIPDYQLPIAVVDEMRAELDQLLEANPDMTADSLFVPHAPHSLHGGGHTGSPGRAPAAAPRTPKEEGPQPIRNWRLNIGGR